MKKIIRGIVISLLVYLTLKYALRWVLPFVLAALVASLLHPLEQRLEQRVQQEKEWKKKVCCMGVTAVFFAALFALFAGMVGFVCWEGKQMQGQFCCVQSYIERFADVVVPQVSGKAYLVGKQALSAGVIVFLTIVASVRFLYDYETFYARMQSTTWGAKMIDITVTAKTAAGAYLKAQGILFLVISLICIAGLYLMKQKRSWLIGCLIGLCDALPFLGTGTVLIPWAVWGIFQKEYAHAIGRLLLYIVCCFIRNVLEPRLIGHRLGVHPLLVMSSMYAGICIYGIGGIVLGPLSIFLIVQLYKSELFL